MLIWLWLEPRIFGMIVRSANHSIIIETNKMTKIEILRLLKELMKIRS